MIGWALLLAPFPVISQDCLVVSRAPLGLQLFLCDSNSSVSLRAQRWTVVNPQLEPITLADHQLVVQDIDDRIKTQEREIAEIHEQLLDISEEDDLPKLITQLSECSSKLKRLGDTKSEARQKLDKMTSVYPAFTFLIAI